MARVREDYERQLERNTRRRAASLRRDCADETRESGLALRVSANYDGPHLGHFVLPPTLA